MNTISRELNEMLGIRGSKFEIEDAVYDYNQTVFPVTLHSGNTWNHHNCERMQKILTSLNNLNSRLKREGITKTYP